MTPSHRTPPQPVMNAVARNRTLLSILAHLGLFTLAYFSACGMLNNFWNFNSWLRPHFLQYAWAAVLFKMVVFGVLKLHSGFWRYVGLRDAVRVFKASTWSECLFIAYVFGYRFYMNWHSGQVIDFPESIFILDWFSTMVLVIGARATVRLYFEESRMVSTEELTRCLILGAGDTGEMLLRETLRMPFERYRIVGFLDDDPVKRRMRIHDVPVLGSLDDVRDVADRYEITELLIAMPSIKHARLRAVVQKCHGTHIRIRTVPAMSDIVAGRVTVSQVRDVDIHDLLGRDPVRLDVEAIAGFIENRRIVITGAGGSIGSEVCRQVVSFRPARVALVEQAENVLFEIDRELARIAPDIERICYIGDVCDAERMNAIFQSERPHAVFHAAAHKHVPLMEANVCEAIKNNVRGTLNVARAADGVGVERLVMISTDKAVNPTSVMGCSKRVAELGVQELARNSKMHCITVRFGNVLGSSGSVVPVFREQIKRGGPVTVTDPEMTRYFMTIPEATQLVLQAGAMGAGGEIFVLDMGEPVKIVDLARQMITLSGFRVGEDIEIKFTGIRPGEKLYEELSVSGEDMSPTHHDKIYVWRQRAEDWDRVTADIEALIFAAGNESDDQLKTRLKSLVPEYRLKLDHRDGRVDARGGDRPRKSADDAADRPATV